MITTEIYLNTNEAQINKVNPKPTGDYTIPSELNGYPVTRFGIPGGNQTGVFTNSGLTSVTIPEGVEYLGMYMFKDCTSLTSVTLPQTLKNMNAETFMSCTKLTNINIPSIVETIGNNAFSSCTSLTRITIPNSVTKIETDAFYGSGLTSVTIPSRVTTIGTGAFKSCPNLLEIIVEEDNQNYSSVDGVLYNKDKTKLIQCPAGKTGTFEIPEGITLIESYAFSGCSKLTKVTIPESVKTIVEYAFTSCAGLTSIMIPEGVTSIGDAAFYSCTGLTSITIPEGVTSIEKWAFKDCSSLTSIISPSTFSSWGPETLLDTNLQAAFFDENATTNTFPTNVGFTNPGSVNRWLYEVLTPASAAPDNKTHVKISGHPGGSATSIKDSAMGDNFVIDDIISSVTLNHDLPSTPDPAVEATCTEPRHVEGYTCKGCGRHFSDVAATTEISEENWITATATGHIEPLEHHAAVAATCTTDGNSEYWYCSQYGKYFNDADGENEIEEGSWVTPAGHSEAVLDTVFFAGCKIDEFPTVTN